MMYEFHNFLRPILLLMYSFWIPQIVTSVIRDSRKPLHPHYILGMTVTRLAIPLYIFGCPNNFMRIEPDHTWCTFLVVFMGLQASILLLQHYLGSRCFIPRQVRRLYSFYLFFSPMFIALKFILNSLISLMDVFLLIVRRFYPRNTATTEGLIRIQAMQQTVSFA